MDYPENSDCNPVISESINTPAKKQIYSITKYCILLSLATMGLGSYLFGIYVSTNVTTIFIYFALLIQLLSKTLRLPKLLLLIYLYIFIQTYILNFQNILSFSSIKHFLGLIIFSISIFSFISVYRDNLINIVKAYYKLVAIIIGGSIIQILIFVLFGVSIIPQNLISGNIITGSSTLVPEIFGILPRAIGLSTEPAHFAIFVLPSVYISILVLTKNEYTFGITNKKLAILILIGYILTFSLVAYFGLALCIISIFAKDLRKGILIKAISLLLFVGLFSLLFQTKIASKVISFIEIQKDIKGHEYTSSDLSAWALVSNLIVANESLRNSNFLGTGLNTHKDSYEKTIYNQFSNSQIILELNKEDAGSLFIRITSEFGIPGILALILFFVYYRLGKIIKSSSLKTINSMCLVVLISYCARAGSYLSVNFILFSAIFYYSFLLLKYEENKLITLDESNIK